MRTEIIRCATLSSLCRCVELFKLSAFCRATVGRFIDTCVSRIANYLFNNSMFSVHSSMRWFSGKMLFSEQRFKARIANCFGCGYNMIWQVSEDAYSVSWFCKKEEKVKSIGSKLFWKSVKSYTFFGNIHQCIRIARHLRGCVWATTAPRAFFPFVSPRGYEKRKIATWLILPVAYACLKD